MRGNPGGQGKVERKGDFAPRFGILIRTRGPKCSGLVFRSQQVDLLTASAEGWTEVWGPGTKARSSEQPERAHVSRLNWEPFSSVWLKFYEPGSRCFSLRQIHIKFIGPLGMEGRDWQRESQTHEK